MPLLASTAVEVVELSPTAMVAGGDALARDADGRVVFVAGALPGERVAAEVVERVRRKDFARARVLTVLEPAPGRVVPPCPHLARGCGGCTWQHADPALQRALKREVVADALRRLGRLEAPEVGDGPGLDPFGYRTTVRMAVGADGRVAYRRAASHDVVEVDSCLVAHPLLAELIGDARFAGADEVVLRCGARTGERLVLASPTAAGVDVPDDVVLVGDDELSAGRRAWLHEEVAGRRWRISARSFAQVRPDGAEALVDVVRAEAGEGGHRMVDAYGGGGLFTGTVGTGRRTTLLERAPSAAADARVNLAGLDARVVRVDVARWRPTTADLVIADPARSGLGRDGVAVLAGTGAARLVLVSCDAAALGRDAALLADLGFDHVRTTVVDLFPGTPHVEAVTLFTRG